MTTSTAPLTIWPPVAPEAPPADRTVHVLSAAATPTCNSTLTGTAATTCAAYTTYSRYLAMGGSALMVAAISADTALTKAGQREAAQDVWAACGAVYTVVQGMDQAFLQAIADLDAGQPFAPVDPPSNLPDFPSAPSGNDAVTTVIDSIWTLVADAVQLVLAKVADGPLKIALEGSLAQGQKAFEYLAPILDKYFGTPSS
ncbi:hypothetical protein ATJ88_1827 [Isoptericola jiangsuensis]|uniref:Uncharacterized protein n=1 Tax=Isoptericola jiangsuensis TaxID=548579 RepID=A0A2A9EWN2_9MICO|nr:hypothetical protein [Isoptericola jiangsuensis]PFG43143.1 hypothetical protein ATJ88_1827 [Isoptericola jiangsuensis]